MFYVDIGSMEKTRLDTRCRVLTNVYRGARKMSKFMNSVKSFLVSEDGPTAVEYAVMLALIIVVCIGTVTTIGNNANAKFQSAANAL